MARTMGNGFQKLQIALAMTNIDLAIIMPAPKEPEKSRKGSEQSRRCMGYSTESP